MRKNKDQSAKNKAARVVQKSAACILSVALAAGFWGCGASSSAASSETSETSASTQTVSSSNVGDLSLYDLEYTNRDLNGTYDASEAVYIALANDATSVSASAQGVSISGNDITITQAGTYVLSGTLSNGCVYVNIDKEEKCQLVLNGVDITNSTGPCIYIMSADKTFITLAEGSQNTLVDGADYELNEDEEPTATIFSKDDLTLNGSGALSITGNYRHAVRSKDDLVITGGTYVINAVEDALNGKDCLKICGGTFDITSGEDALKSSNDSEEGRGFVSIDGGDFTISAGDDAVHAETLMRITSGTVNIETCYEGYEGTVVRIDGGTTNIVASDDGINAASGSSDETPGAAGFGGFGGAGGAGGGDAAGDGGAGGDPGAGTGGAAGGDAAGDGGDPGAGDAGAGMEGAGGEPGAGGASGNDPGAGGSDSAETPDDAGAGRGAGEGAGEGAGDGAANDAAAGVSSSSSEGNACQILVTGGTTYVSASGDGIDSNGSVEITGGVLLVEGPTSSADGFLDYETSATISGGTVLMVGSAGMAQSFSGGTQAFAMQQVSGSAGQTVVLKDASGGEVASFTATKSFQMLLASAEGAAEGDTLTVQVGTASTELTASTSASSTGGFGGFNAAGAGGGASGGKAEGEGGGGGKPGGEGDAGSAAGKGGGEAAGGKTR